MLFSFGLIFSVQGSLLDGPSLLLIAVGMALVESGRPWLGAAVLGVSGLGKDTSVLCGAGIRPPVARGVPGLGARGSARLALVLLPVAAWMLCLRLVAWPRQRHRGQGISGAPFAGLTEKLQQSRLPADRRRATRRSRQVRPARPCRAPRPVLLLRVPQALAGSLVEDRRGYAVLMVFLGDAVWENYPSAAARVLLPMTLAFNIAGPAREMVAAPAHRRQPRHPRLRGHFQAARQGELRRRGTDGSSGSTRRTRASSRRSSGRRTLVRRREGPAWEYWRWGMGDGTVTIRNPAAVRDRGRCQIQAPRCRRARGHRDARRAGSSGSGMLQPAEVSHVSLGEIDLPPGDTVLRLQERPAAAYPGNGDLQEADLQPEGPRDRPETAALAARKLGLDPTGSSSSKTG